MLEQGSNIVDKIYVGANRSQYLYSGSTLTFTDYFYTLEKRVLADGGSHITNSLGNSSLYPVPSLSMFPVATKESKLYSVLPTDGTGDFTVVRATTATRVNAQGLIETVAANVPRINYENGVGSLLVEPQATNLVTYSEDFSNASWSKNNGTITSNSIIAPNGNLTANSFNENNINSAHFIIKSMTQSSGNKYTTSYFFKSNGRDIIELNYSGYTEAVFNLSLGTVISVGNNNGNFVNYSATIKDFGNGWFRCTSTKECISTIAGNLRLYLISQIPYLGDGVSGVYIWGAQLETGSVATSYIPTVESTVTRNDDVISKTEISSLIGQTEGTIYIRLKIKSEEKSFSNIINLGKNITNSVVISRIHSSKKIKFGIYANGGVVFNSEGSVNTEINTDLKIALKYKSGDSKLYINGVQSFSSLSTFSFSASLSEININDSVVYFAYQQSEEISELKVFKTALTDAQLITLTTI
jgi:hypothetical protein